MTPDKVTMCSIVAAILDVTVPQFKGNSYLQLKVNSHIGRSLGYEIWFLATKPDGMYSPKIA